MKHKSPVEKTPYSELEQVDQLLAMLGGSVPEQAQLICLSLSSSSIA